MKGEIRLELSYYNEKISTWEPLIEPVMQSENLYRPWEVLIKVKAFSHSIFSFYLWLALHFGNSISNLFFRSSVGNQDKLDIWVPFSLTT